MIAFFVRKIYEFTVMIDKLLSFKPLEENDIKLLAHWFKQSHIAEWWQEESLMTYEQLYEKYSKKITAADQSAYIVNLNDQPIGYIQSYSGGDVSRMVPLVLINL